ncbi:GNAT family N-acetyltransferase [Actinokineospora sp. UTMC 2448]|uniref:GNAT family N-acetyltransferase n=1 Tax=Actinokineospora sp. UTMC 2448 TaxID=2268449 RepID=UPI00216454B8|nr:GNAT family N-acetyltransferase [Actinokineospora sp. UTMC 2448]UVS80463.1 Acetyltransferase (GNAT) family protein [Actinokineospora sp. UTMC 2448]
MTEHGPYSVRRARKSDVDGARSVMLDTFYHDFGVGYRPEWHADVIDIEGSYLREPRHALFVACKGDEVVATTAVRATGPASPPHPRWIAEKYAGPGTAQLFRVYVRPDHRRAGLARALVAMAVEFVAADPAYAALYLHTDTRVPGAEPFWRAVATEIHDARDGDHRTPETVHFEIPLRRGATPRVV